MNVKGYYYDASRFNDGSPKTFPFPVEMIELQNRYIYQILGLVFYGTRRYASAGPQGNFLSQNGIDAGGLNFTLIGPDNQVLFNEQPYLSICSVNDLPTNLTRLPDSPDFFPINNVIDWRRSYFKKVISTLAPLTLNIGLIVFYE